MMYYIGVDGGGTKSEYVLVDEELNLIRSTIGGPTNINSTGYEGVRNNIHTSLRDLLGDIEPKSVNICLASAGVNKESDKVNYQSILDDFNFNNCYIVNDANAALAAGTKGHPGIIVIAGTGSIVFGKNKIEKRVGGWGHIVGDEGSAYKIAIEGIKKALHYFDGYGKETSLLDLLTDEIRKHDCDNFIDFIYKKNFTKDRIALLSKTVNDAANAGDKVAREIIELEAEALAKQILYLKLELFGDKVNVVVNGSVVKNSKLFRNKLENVIGFECIDLEESASMGAVYIAKRLANESDN